LELLRELIPQISRVGVLWDAAGPGPAIAFKEYAVAARAFDIDLKSLDVHDPKPNFEGVIEAAKKAGAEAMVVVGNPLIGQYERQIFQLAIKNRLPTLTEDRRRVVAGGLISYGAKLSELYRVAARYVDGILKGAKPAEMLVEQPTVFEIFLNLKTAKQLGVEIPRRVLLRANELIE
jgi:putative ABC transport system substrate-binding protein